MTDFETGDIEFVVVGIGLNLYEPIGGFPKELKEKAGAILPEEQNVDKNKLVGELVNQLLLETEKSGIPQEYISRNIVPGKKSTRLLLEKPNGKYLPKKYLLTEGCWQSMRKMKKKYFLREMFL